jgi:hypothetical protein
MELADHCGGRALGQEERAADGGLEIGQTLFIGGRQIRQHRRAVARRDRDRLDGPAFDLRQRDRRVGHW